ncbi:hypothetical protein [Sphingomonas nostoxanthinifaciens]|uniref:hypothetical protein n=1 Tax=Sphingomonas nostoxanthinifaciens TaxID=2872652 RepID=UPI001CC1EA1A|nr:hypothetical protein [Sphingomonas nostoxanthinifaciens]UAK23249.1 hypothetical protein K8P63_12620 [Sphingomonas nostoxanthinifaciens]
MHGIVAAATGLALLVLLPLLISWMKPFSRRKGRLRGIGSGIDAGFAVFDPAKARALQTIEMRKDVGHADEGDQGDLHEPSPQP